MVREPRTPASGDFKTEEARPRVPAESELANSGLTPAQREHAERLRRAALALEHLRPAGNRIIPLPALGAAKAAPSPGRAESPASARCASGAASADPPTFTPDVDETKFPALQLPATSGKDRFSRWRVDPVKAEARAPGGETTRVSRDPHRGRQPSSGVGELSERTDATASTLQPEHLSEGDAPNLRALASAELTENPDLGPTSAHRQPLAGRRAAVGPEADNSVDMAGSLVERAIAALRSGDMDRLDALRDAGLLGAVEAGGGPEVREPTGRERTAPPRGPTEPARPDELAASSRERAARYAEPLLAMCADTAATSASWSTSRPPNSRSRTSFANWRCGSRRRSDG